MFERPGGDYVAPAVPGPLNHLIECIEKKAEPVAPIEEARKSFVVALAAYEAALTGKPVRMQVFGSAGKA